MRFWIEFWYGAYHSVRCVDMACADLDAGYCPIDAMWQELQVECGAAGVLMRLAPEVRAARVIESSLLEADLLDFAKGVAV